MKGDYIVKGEEKDGPPAKDDKVKDSTKPKLVGKRKAKESSPEPLMAASAAPKGKALAKAEEKKQKKEASKEEEKQLPTRKSTRNEGKVANYNIDDILDAAEAEQTGGIVVTGGKVSGGHIQVMLAQTYKPELLPDPKGWYISEKLDGVRCYWNGSAMYTRNNNLFYPPDWFKKFLPKDMWLDGELWTGRADF
jgi:DNA ligase-1